MDAAVVPETDNCCLELRFYTPDHLLEMEQKLRRPTMNDTFDTIERITKIQEAQALKREVVADYLDDILHDDGHVFVERSKMGDSESYVGVVSFRWIDKNMKLFTELPLFKEKIDTTTGNFIIDEETVS